MNASRAREEYNGRNIEYRISHKVVTMDYIIALRKTKKKKEKTIITARVSRVSIQCDAHSCKRQVFRLC